MSAAPLQSDFNPVHLFVVPPLRLEEAIELLRTLEALLLPMPVLKVVVMVLLLERRSARKPMIQIA